ncbi:Ig domain-containing protein, partial [Nostoc sp. NIES-2111]
INLGPIPAAIRNAAYAHTFTATGGSGSYTYSLVGGSLPTGLTLNNNGLLNGTPTVLGIFPIVVRVTDGSNNTNDGNFIVTVNATALTITPTTLPPGALNVPYSTTLGASGGTAPYNFSVASGALPPGLTLSTTGVLSGSPTQAGTFQFTVGVVDNSSVSSTAGVTITISPSSILISTSGLAVGQTGIAYSSSLSASGGTPPYTFILINGSLPPGLTLFASGAITGTPTLAGSYNFTVRVNDTTNAFAEQQVTLNIASSGITIITAALPNAVLNTSYSASIAVSGGLAPYQFQINAGQLPPGLFLNQNTGAITGTPTLSGSYPFTIRATDNFNATALANFTINVGSGLITLVPSS